MPSAFYSWNNRSYPAKSKMVSRLLLCLLAAAALSPYAQSQVFPNFPTPTASSQFVQADATVTSAAVPNAVLGTIMMSVFGNQNNFAYGLAANGATYDRGTGAVSSIYGVPFIGCTAATPSTCAASIAVLNGVIYIAYADASNRSLDVITGTPVSGEQIYNWTYLHNDASVSLTTAPAIVATDPNHLLLVFASDSDPRTGNAFYSVGYNDIDKGWTPASEAGLGAVGVSSESKPGLAVYNGSVYLSVQENSSHGLLLYSTNDGSNWNLVVRVPTVLIGGDMQMVSYNGSLIFATQSNDPAKVLTLYSSPDGTSWYQRQYPYYMSYGPGLALYNGGVSVAYRNQGDYYVYGSFSF